MEYQETMPEEMRPERTKDPWKMSLKWKVLLCTLASLSIVGVYILVNHDSTDVSKTTADDYIWYFSSVSQDNGVVPEYYSISNIETKFKGKRREEILTEIFRKPQDVARIANFASARFSIIRLLLDQTNGPADLVHSAITKDNFDKAAADTLLATLTKLIKLSLDGCANIVLFIMNRSVYVSFIGGKTLMSPYKRPELLGQLGKTTEQQFADIVLYYIEDQRAPQKPPPAPSPTPDPEPESNSEPPNS